jgi:hypothetical protein
MDVLHCESEYNRGAGCGKTAHPDLYGIYAIVRLLPKMDGNMSLCLIILYHLIIKTGLKNITNQVIGRPLTGYAKAFAFSAAWSVSNKDKNWSS